jgi:hypothetical protein
MKNQKRSNLKDQDKVERVISDSERVITELLVLSKVRGKTARYDILDCLGDLSDLIIERLRIALVDKDELIRANTIAIFDSLSIEEHSISDCLDDDSLLVRSEAMIYLAHRGHQTAINRIKKKIKKASAEELVRIYYALIVLGDSKYLNDFLQLLQHDFYRVRCACANLSYYLVTLSRKKRILSALEKAFKIEKTKAARSSIKKAIGDIREWDLDVRS